MPMIPAEAEGRILDNLYPLPDLQPNPSGRKGFEVNMIYDSPTGVVFSEDHSFRYSLWRKWSKSRPPLLFIGLNPSTAGQFKNDPTITRGMVRAANWGFGGFLVGNLHPFVSADPSKLPAANRPEEFTANDEYLQAMIKISGKVMIGWGSFNVPGIQDRAGQVLELIPEPFCLGLNADGNPKHPLYVKYSQELIPFIIKSGKEKE